MPKWFTISITTIAMAVLLIFAWYHDRILTIIAPATNPQQKVAGNRGTPQIGHANPFPIVPISGPCSAASVAPSARVIYMNATYGFQVTFDKTIWINLKADEVSDVSGSMIRIEIPVTAGHGYAEAFSLSILPNTSQNLDWVNHGSGPRPIYLAQNRRYLAGYWWSQDPPRNLTDCQIAQAISSFRFNR